MSVLTYIEAKTNQSPLQSAFLLSARREDISNGLPVFVEINFLDHS